MVQNIAPLREKYPLVEVVRIQPTEWNLFAQRILEIECDSFPPSIQESPKALKKIVESPTSIVFGLTASSDSTLIGYLAADRLEFFKDVPGVPGDPNFGAFNTLYIASLAIASNFRGAGLGVFLTKSCITEALALGFSRVTAHVDRKTFTRSGIEFNVLGCFSNWYKTGRTFDYLELKS
jgi:ribosomal protein S18 acetylase RimI-like enzyme